MSFSMVQTVSEAHFLICDQIIRHSYRRTTKCDLGADKTIRMWFYPTPVQVWLQMRVGQDLCPNAIKVQNIPGPDVAAGCVTIVPSFFRAGIRF